MPRRDQLSAVSHSWLVLREAFVPFDWRRDMWIGAFTGLVTLAYQVFSGLSAAEDWHKHAVQLVFSFIAPILLVLAADCLWKLGKALRHLYWQRKQIRPYMHYAGRFFAFVLFILGGYFYLQYVRSPHLSLYRGPVCFSDYRQAPTSPTTLMSIVLRVENSGVPTRITEWKLKVKLQSGGEELEGKPYLNFGNISIHPFNHPERSTNVGPTDTIFWRASVLDIQKKVPVEGYATFLFPNVVQQTLNTPGNRYTLVCVETGGREFSIDFVVPPEELGMPN